MALGTVITAKGKQLDFADLVRRARTPIQSGVDLKDKIEKMPAPAQQSRVRGNMPSHAAVRAPKFDKTTPTATEKTVLRPARPIEQRSLADFTEVKIDEAKHLKARPEDPMQTANEALQEILTSDRSTFGTRPASKALKR